MKIEKRNMYVFIYTQNSQTIAYIYGILFDFFPS